MFIKNNYKFLFLLLSVFVSSAICLNSASAATSTSWFATAVSGDSVQFQGTGSPNSAVQLFFSPAGAGSPAIVSLGSTDNNGDFSVTMSSGAYGIPSGVQSYIVVSGQKSSTVAWPTYTSSLTLNDADVQLLMGQDFFIQPSASASVSFNSATSVVSATAVNGQIMLAGVNYGTAIITICGANVGCANANVVVASQFQSSLSFSQNNVSLKTNQTSNVDILYTGSNAGEGFTVAYNSNPAVVETHISGQSNVITLYGGGTAGTAIISVCSQASSNVCNNLYVTNSLSDTNRAIILSQTSVLLSQGQSTAVSASGDSGNSYFLSSNSNSGVAMVNINGSTITLTGGSTIGSASVQICSNETRTSCAILSISTNNLTSSAISFAQNNVVMSVGQNTTTTIYGASGGPYFVYSNTNPSVVFASVAGNALSLAGRTSSGASVITVCSSADRSNCGKLNYSNSGKNFSSSSITFSQSSVSMSLGQSAEVIIQGDVGSSFAVYSNTNPSVVFGNVTSGNRLSLLGRSTSGSSIISVCVVGGVNCGKLNVYVGSGSARVTFSQSTMTLESGQSQTVALSGGKGNNYFVYSNTNPSAVFAKASGNSLIVTGRGESGSATISVCSEVAGSNCSKFSVKVTTGSSISAAQNNVILNQGQTLTVSLAGLSEGYRVYSNSDKNVVLTSIKDNILSLNGGDTSGKATVVVCPVSNNKNCTNVYVVNSSYVSPLTFSQKVVVVGQNQSAFLSVYYGLVNDSFAVSFNSNPEVVKVIINRNSKLLTLIGGSVSGTAVVAICSDSVKYDCGHLYITTTVPRVSGDVVQVTPSPSSTPAPVANFVATTYVFKRDLKYGMTGADVKELQKYLNNNGFVITTSGSGSPGKETTKFGAMTRKALVKLQKANKISPAIGYFGQVTRKFVNTH